MTVARQAHRFALDPNNRQRGRLASPAGGARYACNLGLQWFRTSLADFGVRLGAHRSER